MTPTKDQQAQEYAEKKLEEAFPEDWICEEDMRGNNFNGYDIKQAYSDGYTAAEQPMWRRVEEELPEDDTRVLTVGPYDFSDPFRYEVAYWDGEDWYTTDNEHIRPTHWMRIPTPSLPDTNTEKKCGLATSNK